MIRLASSLLVLLAAFLVIGCGGGGGGQEFGDSIDPQVGDVLRAAGLTIIFESSKDTYQKGETVHFWLSIRNDSSRAHTVTVHSKGEGFDTYEFWIWNVTASQRVWANTHYDTPSWQIQPGQTVRLFDVQWDQSMNTGGSVAPGVYEAHIDIRRVWLDGKQTSPLPLSLRGLIAIQ